MGTKQVPPISLQASIFHPTYLPTQVDISAMSGNQSASGYNPNTNGNTNGNGSGANNSNNSNSNQYSAMNRWLAEGKKDGPWNAVNKGSGSPNSGGNGAGGSSSRR